MRTLVLAVLAVLALSVSCYVQPAQPPLPQQPGAGQAGTYGGATYGGATYGGATYGGAANGGGAYGGFSYGAVTVEDIRDDQGHVFHVTQGPRGAASQLGCADGQREAFVNHDVFQGVAGCLASWNDSRSMRDAPTGAACGDDLGPCAVPADACAPGWQVCGADGSVAQLRALSAEQCETAGGGRFSAAVSHCTAQSGCNYDGSASASYPCFDSGWCSETVCCGNDCGQFGTCRDGIWPGKTHIAIGTDQGCGHVSSRRAGGVLCCHRN